MVASKLEKSPVFDLSSEQCVDLLVEQEPSLLDLRIKASRKLVTGLRDMYEEKPEQFEKSCNQLLDNVPVYKQHPIITENLVIAIGDSMFFEIDYHYPEIFNKAWKVFEEGLEKEDFRDHAQHYLSCMDSGEDPLDVGISLPANEFTGAIDYYVSPNLLKKDEKLFEVGFKGVCSRIEQGHRELVSLAEQRLLANEDTTAARVEIADDLVTLLEILDSCMNPELKEKRLDLYERGKKVLWTIANGGQKEILVEE